MLYSFLPPILIVLSVIGIIVMLVRKAPAVAGIAAQESQRPDISAGKKSSLFSRYEKSDETVATNGFKHKGLIILEKTTRKMKIMFLKLENIFSSWSESIRKKRKNISISETNSETGQPKELGDDVIEKVESYPDPVKPASKRFSVRDLEEKPVRPMISEKVTEPKMTPEKKNRLEKILIDRIAANPKDIEAYERLGEYYFEIENFNHAKECFKQVLKLDSGNYNSKNKLRKLERLLYK